MKSTIVVSLAVLLVGPVLFIGIFGSGGLSLSNAICLRSEISISEENRITKSLESFGESENMHIRNLTNSARSVEESQHLVHLEFWERRFFPSFRLLVILNPEYGGSRAVLYGRGIGVNKGNEVMSEISSLLASYYAFGVSEPGDHGQCD